MTLSKRLTPPMESNYRLYKLVSINMNKLYVETLIYHEAISLSYCTMNKCSLVQKLCNESSKAHHKFWLDDFKDMRAMRQQKIKNHARI